MISTRWVWIGLGILAILCPIAQALPPSQASLPWVYWADNDTDTINRMRVDGASPEVLASAPNALGVAVHQQAGLLFWVDLQGGGRVMRSNLDGTAPTPIYSQSGFGMGQVVVDPLRSHVYWVNNLSNRILRSGLNGEDLTTVYESTRPLGNALEVDASRGLLFFTTGGFSNDPRVERINIDGTENEVLASTYGYSIALDELNETIYTADWDEARIVRLGYDGQGLTQVVDPELKLRDVQVFNNSLYYPDVRSELVEGRLAYFFQWVRSDLDGLNRQVLHEVPRAQGIGPQDMIQFVLVVPEPTSLLLAVPMIGLVGLRPMRKG